MFAKVDAFPKLKKKTNLAHCIYDLGLPPQTDDNMIYEKAVQEKRFVLTVNFKDFKKLVKKGQMSIIGIESELTNQQIDKLVTDFISGEDPESMLGQAFKI